MRLCSALAVAVAPLWLAAAVLIAVESPGPILFVQERIGLLAWDRPHAAPTQVAQAILGK